MSQENNNYNGVFGGGKFEGANVNENTSYFDGNVKTEFQNPNVNWNGENNTQNENVKEQAWGTENNTQNQNIKQQAWGTENNTQNASQPFETQKGNANVFKTYGMNNNFGANEQAKNGNMFQPIGREKAITKQGLWSRIKAFLFQEIDLTAPIKVELTPYQQKVEDEINEFLHQEVSFKGIFNAFKGKNKK